MSSRTDLHDDVVDVTSFSALDVVEQKKKSLSSSLSLSALDVVEIIIIKSLPSSLSSLFALDAVEIWRKGVVVVALAKTRSREPLARCAFQTFFILRHHFHEGDI